MAMTRNASASATCRGARRWGPAILAAVCLVAGAASELSALDRRRAASQYVVASWGATVLRSNSVHAVLQARDGYVWLGTSNGLLRYDGTRFVAFDAVENPGVGDGGVTTLAEGPDGTLYIGTTSGTVSEYKSGQFREIALSRGVGRVYSLMVAEDGALWIGRLGHPITRWLRGQSLSFHDEKQTLSLRSTAPRVEGGLWIGTWTGLVRYDGEAFQPAGVTGDTVQALYTDRAGVVWVGTPHGLLRWDGQRAQRFTTRNGLSHDSVSALLEDRDGNLWIGTTRGGLNRLTGGRFSRLGVAEGLSDDHVLALAEDREGNLWVGTADGLDCISDSRFVTYGRQEGLRDHAITALAEAGDGSVWAGSISGEVARLRDGGVEHLRLPRGLGWEGITALHVARDGSLWICVDNGRLFRFAGGVLHEHTPLGNTARRKVRAVFEEADGLRFLVTEVGLARLRGRRLVPTPPDLEPLGYLHSAHRDRSGVLWICGSLGVGRLDGTRLRILTTGDGLPHERVRWASEDEDGSLWLATAGGLARVQGERIQALTTRQGLPENYVRLVLDDGLGRLWAACNGHIFSLRKQEVLDVFAGRRAAVSPVVYDTSDGLRTTDSILSNSPGFRGRDGRLWFATAKGVAVVDPRRLSTDHPAGRVMLERVEVDGVQGARREYPPGRGEVLIEYTALSFTGASKVRFRHRLEGYDADWQDAGDKRSAYYSNLPPGEYRFSVAASNRDGVWPSRSPASFSFRILPPFTRTPLFYLLSATLLAGAGFAAHRVRLARMRARFGEIIGERTRIARELHDTLAQGLAAATIQIDTASESLAQGRDAAQRHLQTAKAMLKFGLDEVRRSIWLLRAHTARGRQGLGATLSRSLEQLAADAGVAIHIRVIGRPRPLSTELEHNLLRIAHEAVTNALRHAAAGAIAVDLQFEAGEVQLRIKDDGRGFDPEERRRRGGDHFGLVGMLERARGLNGELLVNARPGAGTEICCRLPYGCPTAAAEAEAEAEAMVEDAEGVGL